MSSCSLSSKGIYGGCGVVLKILSVKGSYFVFTDTYLVMNGVFLWASFSQRAPDRRLITEQLQQLVGPGIRDSEGIRWPPSPKAVLSLSRVFPRGGRV